MLTINLLPMNAPCSPFVFLLDCIYYAADGVFENEGHDYEEQAGQTRYDSTEKRSKLKRPDDVLLFLFHMISLLILEKI